jgi:hypothetical protein
VEHTVYTITFTAVFRDKTPASLLKVEEDLLNSIANVPHDGLDVVELEAEDDESKDLVKVNSKISPRDYGVIQVGVELVTQWCENLFKGRHDYYYSQIMIHPTEESYGALLEYDYGRKELIIKRIT